MKTTTISILRQNIKAYIDGVIETDEPVLVNKGADGAVILSLCEYNRLIGTASAGMPCSPARSANVPATPSEETYVDVDIDDL